MTDRNRYEFHPLLPSDLPEVLEFNKAVWPVYFREGDGGPAGELYVPLFSEFAAFQACVREEGRLVAVINSVPLKWDGSVSSLPPGWDGALLRAFGDDRGSADTLCAIGVGISPAFRGVGLSPACLAKMKELARLHGLKRLIAPVRPTMKVQFREMQMKDYLAMKREDGAPYDPWLRVHWRLGATVLAVAENSITIRGSIAQWSKWSGMTFSKSGLYLVPDTLAKVHIDLERDLGTYVEPNVWLSHPM